MRFRHGLRVRWGECDPQGIVFNANHLAYFDVAVTELWREAFGSYQAMVDTGADLLLATVTLDFHAPPRADEMLDLGLEVERFGTTSLTMRYEERRDGDLLVSGRSVHVFVDPRTLTKIEIPGGVRERLAPYAVG